MDNKAIIFTSWTRFFLPIFIILAAKPTSAQPGDSALSVNYFGGSVAAMNNGISLLPTFSLNKPAALITMSAGSRLSFEPEFRFSLEGKPWAFIFWGRYKLIQHDKFRFTVGAHPGYLFITQSLASNDKTSNMISTERYLAGELSPNYFITKNTSIGMYYLRSKGFEESSVKNTHFITLNANFNKIGAYKSYYLKFSPQIYYLKMDENDGYYLTSTLTLVNINFPLSVQMMINQTIESKIPSKDFIWNVSLIYSFGKHYRAI